MRVTPTGCLGPCTEGCVAVVYPDATWYGKVRLTDVAEILDQHIAKGKKLDRLIIDDELLD